MQYIPITVIVTLTASLVMSLLAVPILGSIVGRPGGNLAKIESMYQFSIDGDHSRITGLAGAYVRLLNLLLKAPWLVLFGFIVAALCIVFIYNQLGKGVDFFPSMEPERAQVNIRARGNLSIYERDAIVAQVEQTVLGFDEIRVVSTTTTTAQPRGTLDIIGTIVLEFEDWYLRRPAQQILEDIRDKTSSIYGVIIETKVDEMGPPSDADLVLEMNSTDLNQLDHQLDQFVQLVRNDGAFYEISDTKPLPTIVWNVNVDRKEASLLGASVNSVGTLVRLITNGVKVGSYIPDNASQKIDLLARFPHNDRSLDQLSALRLNTASGEVPLSRFVEVQPALGKAQIRRVEGSYAYTLYADVRPGEEKPASIARITQALRDIKLPPTVSWRLRGSQEDQQEAATFLSEAFIAAFFVMLIILVTQFRSFYQAFMILSAIVFSVFGVFIGLMIRAEPFGIVMSGMGIIALSGIVVNNNIILIDNYNTLRRQGMEVKHAILCTGAQRLRPILLTSITTVIGLLPMVLQWNIDLVNRGFTMNEPTSQLWVQLSSAIAGGLAFALPLTLILTPCLLYIGDRKKAHATTTTVAAPAGH